jgi:prepilin-type N-terminal cleavage/methylation domain-containing protein/prepilin-type processing-associated H-X9-DG protein
MTLSAARRATNAYQRSFKNEGDAMSMERNAEQFSGRKAFTLIELLVVVAIIALLISILLPSLNRAREQTKNVVCASNLRSMGQGVAIYTNENNGVLPGPLHPPIYRQAGEIRDEFEDDSNVNEENDLDRNWYLLSRLAPIMASGSDPYHELVDQVATCPTHSKKNPDKNFYPGVTPEIPPFDPPDDGSSPANPDFSKPFHYLPNMSGQTSPTWYFGIINRSDTWGVAAQLPKELRPKQLSTINRTSDEWAIGDAWTKRFGGRGGSWRLGTWNIGNDRTDAGASLGPLPTRPVHNDWRGTNLLYFDGHADMFMLGGTELEDVREWGVVFPANPSESFRTFRDTLIR